jgi:hypothetical protein
LPLTTFKNKFLKKIVLSLTLSSCSFDVGDFFDSVVIRLYPLPKSFVAWLIFPTDSNDVVSLRPLLHTDEVIGSYHQPLHNNINFFFLMIKIKGMINTSVMLKSHKHV